MRLAGEKIRESHGERAQEAGRSVLGVKEEKREAEGSIVMLFVWRRQLGFSFC